MNLPFPAFGNVSVSQRMEKEIFTGKWKLEAEIPITFVKIIKQIIHKELSPRFVFFHLASFGPARLPLMS